MNNRYVLLAAAALALLLAGCGGMKTQPPATPPETVPTTPSGEQAPPPPGEQTPPPPAEPTPQAAAESSIAELGPRPPASENKAVLALLERAHADAAAGQRESAEASLERALRIEPRNPWLWHEMAALRVIQGQYAQAITLARKSSSFSGGKHRVQAENWQVIGQARVAQGDSAGADQAFKQAAELAKQARGE